MLGAEGRLGNSRASWAELRLSGEFWRGSLSLKLLRAGLGSRSLHDRGAPGKAVKAGANQDSGRLLRAQRWAKMQCECGYVSGAEAVDKRGRVEAHLTKPIQVIWSTTSSKVFL